MRKFKQRQLTDGESKAIDPDGLVAVVDPNGKLVGYAIKTDAGTVFAHFNGTAPSGAGFSGDGPMYSEVGDCAGTFPSGSRSGR